MKTKSFIVTLLLVLSSALAVPAVNAEEAAKEPKVGKRTLKKYDADKDGQLSPEEQAVRQADNQKRKEEREAKKQAKKAAAGEPAK